MDVYGTIRMTHREKRHNKNKTKASSQLNRNTKSRQSANFFPLPSHCVSNDCLTVCLMFHLRIDFEKKCSCTALFNAFEYCNCMGGRLLAFVKLNRKCFIYTNCGCNNQFFRIAFINLCRFLLVSPAVLYFHRERHIHRRRVAFTTSRIQAQHPNRKCGQLVRTMRILIAQKAVDYRTSNAHTTQTNVPRTSTTEDKW